MLNRATVLPIRVCVMSVLIVASMCACSKEREAKAPEREPQAETPSNAKHATEPNVAETSGEDAVVPSAKDLVAAGELSFNRRGCGLCHSTDTARAQGPGLGGMFGKERKLANGTLVTADDAYLRDTLLNPNRSRLEGWSAMMPAYGSKMSETEVTAMVEYLKSLSD